MEKKKKLFTLHVDLGDFQPASAEEKEYMVQMRPSTTFFKDGMKRLLKNKIATISMIMIILITLSAVILPALWPYSYDQMLGVRPGKPVDATYNNLHPLITALQNPSPCWVIPRQRSILCLPMFRLPLKTRQKGKPLSPSTQPPEKIWSSCWRPMWPPVLLRKPSLLWKPLFLQAMR